MSEPDRDEIATDAADALSVELTRLRRENDRLQIQLASVAALAKDGAPKIAPDEFGFSEAYDAVLALRKRKGRSLDAPLRELFGRVQNNLRQHDCFEQECGTCQLLAEISKLLDR